MTRYHDNNHVNLAYHFRILPVLSFTSYLSLDRLTDGSLTGLQDMVVTKGDKFCRKLYSKKMSCFHAHLTLWQISVRSAPLNPLVTRARWAKSTSY